MILIYLSGTVFISVTKDRSGNFYRVCQSSNSIHCKIYILHDFVNSPLSEFVRMLFELKRLRDFVMLGISIDSTTSPHLFKIFGFVRNCSSSTL